MSAYPDLAALHAHPAPAAVFAECERALKHAWRALLDKDRGTFGEGTAGQMRVIVDHLIEIRRQLLEQRVPSHAMRISEAPIRMFVDDWDPGSPFGNYISNLFSIYANRLVPGGPAPAGGDAEVERIVADRAIQRAAEAESAPPLPAPDPDARKVPHHPDARSLRTMRAASERSIAESEPFEDRLEWWSLWSLSQQFAIRAYTAYWLCQPTAGIVADLRRACRIAGKAIAKGYPAHIWDLQQLFVDAVAVGEDGIAAQVIARKEADWNQAQVRPVPWLSARLRCLFALHRGEDAALPALIEDARRATFVDVLPPELEPDRPLIVNAFHLVQALHARDQGRFATLLAERMDLLARHYHRNLAPAALADTFGLALCRWARDRGLTAAVEHVYLPLDWLPI